MHGDTDWIDVVSNRQTQGQCEGFPGWDVYWQTMRTVIRTITRKGGKVMIDWPRRCKGWKSAVVKELCEELHMNRLSFHTSKMGVEVGDGTLVDLHERCRGVWPSGQEPG